MRNIGVNEDVRQRGPSEVSGAIEEDAALQLCVARRSNSERLKC